MYTINEKERKTNKQIREKNFEKTRGPHFLPQTQKHVHKIKTKQISSQIKPGNETNHATCI
jgi:hypothetical protein